MRKVLTAISELEKDEGLSLIALHATYETLLKITRYPIDKKKVQIDLERCNCDLQKYWDKITSKYKIPLYVDRPMGIDNEKCLIYIEE